MHTQTRVFFGSRHKTGIVRSKVVIRELKLYTFYSKTFYNAPGVTCMIINYNVTKNPPSGTSLVDEVELGLVADVGLL